MPQNVAHPLNKRCLSADEAGVRPWGFWATLAWGVVVFAAFLGVQLALLVAFTAGAGVPGEAQALVGDGLFVSVSTIAGGLAGTGLALWLAAVHRGLPARHYLAFVRPRLRSLVLWALAAAGFWAAFDGLASLLERPTPEFMVDIYATAVSPTLLCVALVVFAPLFEETLFRGFLFHGWSHSRLGVWGTILLTAALWAGMHLQYEAFEIGGLFCYGVLLGVARHRTASLAVPLALHAVTNAVAFAQLALAVR